MNKVKKGEEEGENTHPSESERQDAENQCVEYLAKRVKQPNPSGKRVHVYMCVCVHLKFDTKKTQVWKISCVRTAASYNGDFRL